MSRVRRTSAACAVLFGLLGPALAGCSNDASGPGGSREATPQALAAAVLAHTGSDPVAVAPLGRDEGVRRGDVGVELALARTEGNNAHVRVVVTRRDPFDGDPCEGPWRCRDVSDGGVPATLQLEGGYPEEDPGILAAWSERGELWVYASAHGPFVDADDPSREVRDLADTLVAVVTDPDVDLRTSAAYAEGGRAVCEGGRWLRWYGDGNGSPQPDGFVDWCG